MARKLVDWRIECERQSLALDAGGDWGGSFIRRLHGESLIGDFWHRMSSIYLERPPAGWRAAEALHRWVRTLLEYWDPGGSGSASTVGSLLAGCPILKPFARKSLDQAAWMSHLALPEIGRQPKEGKAS